MLAWLCLASSLAADFQETIYPDWRQTFSVDQVIYHEKTDFWTLDIFENQIFGRVMALNGVIQVTEKDEYVYHEMMAHVPLLTHPNPKSVLIVGGGDGGLLREVLRHDSLERVIQVEIDGAVIELAKKYFPKVCALSYENPKVKIIIQDAAQFVKETEDRFDVILIDSNDPEGAAQVLFTSEFYGNCKRVLTPGGILVNQNGVPFLQTSELALTQKNRSSHFKHATFYVIASPTYTGGLMALGFASDKKYPLSEKKLRERLGKISGRMLYYTPAIHKASFSLPAFMLDQLEKKGQ